MACQRIVTADGAVGWVCGPKPRRKRCACGRESTKLCDYPLRGRAAGRTCDAPLCDACAVVQGTVTRIPTGDVAQIHRSARLATDADVRARMRAELAHIGPDVDTVDYCAAHARLGAAEQEAV